MEIMINMKEKYKIETYVQTMLSGDQRIVVQLFEVTRKLVKQFFIPIKPEEFYEK